MILQISDFWIIISSIGCFISGVTSILLFIVGWTQIKKYISIGELDLYYKLKNDFSSPNSVKLYNSIVKDEVLICYDKYRIPSLCIKLNESLINENYYEDYYTLNDDLLGHVEDMCIFYNDGLISKTKLTEGYGTIVTKCFENKTIQEYIKLKREQFKEPLLYTGLEILYNKMTKE